MLIRGSTLNFGGFLGIPLLFSIKIPALGLIVAGPLAVIISSFADQRHQAARDRGVRDRDDRLRAASCSRRC